MKNEDPVPVVGMGCTVYGYSDSHACTVVAVFQGGRKLLVRKDKATLLNREEAAKGAKQNWSLERNDQGEQIVVTLRQTKDGPVWRQAGYRLGTVAGTVSLGERHHYYDFKFSQR